MLTAHQLSKSYHLKTILTDVSFNINAGERVGLIGPNGSGKTTLLKILTDEEHADSGHISLTPSNLKIGYLSQGRGRHFGIGLYFGGLCHYRRSVEQGLGPSLAGRY